MSTAEPTLDAPALYQDLRHCVQTWLAQQPSATVRLVGIASGGVWLAERLQQDLGLAGKAGIISSVMHRDDFAQRGLSHAQQTRLEFEINGAHIVLLDDVLHTGRTVRAVLNELFDFGRPASVRLAVLVDRGGRELPIQADFASTRITLTRAQSLTLQLDTQQQFRFVVEPA